MIEQSAHFRKYRCFRDGWAGFERVAPLNILIGRNNSGKSCLLDLLGILTQPKARGTVPRAPQLRVGCVLEEPELRSAFPETTSGGPLEGNHWHKHGAQFVGQKVKWTPGKDGPVGDFKLPDMDIGSPYGRRSTEKRRAILFGVLKKKPLPLSHLSFRRLVADRDIVPEAAEVSLSLESNGRGATNVIRRFLNSTRANYPRDVILVLLRDALNRAFGLDAHFTEIEVQQHDETQDEGLKDHWEVFLAEKTKGLVALSNSGSGLKTVILVLLNLLVAPRIDRKKPSEYLFAFEELENNLHPALLRRLLGYIEEFAVRQKCPVFLTTHSSAVLDMYATSPNAQIIHVEHNGEYATTRTLKTHFEGLSVIDDLGAKPSDLLQANGIVWVEGPSDRIYVNRWIELFSKGELREGRHYQCAFFGGSLLENYAYGKSLSDDDRADILQINKNAILIADGDRTAPRGEGSRIKQRVSRIKAAIQKPNHGHVWVTDAKEIENYIPAAVLAEVWRRKSLPEVGKYEHFSRTPTPKDRTKGYIQKHCGRKGFDKVELARKVAPLLLTSADLAGRFELAGEMKKVCDRIRGWNDL